MNTLILPSMGFLTLQLFYNNGFGIKKLTQVDIPLNKETKLNQ